MVYLKYIIVGVCLLNLLSACGANKTPSDIPAKQDTIQTGTNQTITLKHQGRERQFILHIPDTLDRTHVAPVIINLHGGGGNAEGQQQYSRMDRAAAEYKFIVVYPNGTGQFENRLLTWNAGTCCGYAMQNGIDDVGFIRKVIDTLPRYIKIDPRRVYATGLSNGGMMSYRLALELSDKITAIAPVAGAMHVAEFHPKRPIPIMHFHSVDDPRALYRGGLGPAFPLTNQRVEHRDVTETLELWAENNRCQQGPFLYKEASVDIDANTKHRAEKWAWTACAQRADVVHWKLTVAGHVWPGGQQDYLTKILGPGTQVIDANEQMWLFFSQYQLATN